VKITSTTANIMFYQTLPYTRLTYFTSTCIHWVSHLSESCMAYGL